jgi:hypothetical protein
LAAIAWAHGVRQVCPVDVFASAPAGSDSNWIVVVDGPNPGNEKLGMPGMPEHPARLRLQAAMATVRFMIASVYCCGARPRPGGFARDARTEQPGIHSSMCCRPRPSHARCDWIEFRTNVP